MHDSSSAVNVILNCPEAPPDVNFASQAWGFSNPKPSASQVWVSQ